MRRLTLDNAGLERPQDPQEEGSAGEEGGELEQSRLRHAPAGPILSIRDAQPKAGQAQEEKSVAHGATLVRPG